LLHTDPSESTVIISDGGPQDDDPTRFFQRPPIPAAGSAAVVNSDLVENNSAELTIVWDNGSQRIVPIATRDVPAHDDQQQTRISRRRRRTAAFHVVAYAVVFALGVGLTLVASRYLSSLSLPFGL
jgi:hypothetical protein